MLIKDTGKEKRKIGLALWNNINSCHICEEFAFSAWLSKSQWSLCKWLQLKCLNYVANFYCYQQTLYVSLILSQQEWIDLSSALHFLTGKCPGCLCVHRILSHWLQTILKVCEMKFCFFFFFLLSTLVLSLRKFP